MGAQKIEHRDDNDDDDGNDEGSGNESDDFLTTVKPALSTNGTNHVAIRFKQTPSEGSAKMVSAVRERNSGRDPANIHRLSEFDYGNCPITREHSQFDLYQRIRDEIYNHFRSSKGQSASLCETQRGTQVEVDELCLHSFIVTLLRIPGHRNYLSYHDSRSLL
ncbi:hypothetical protein FAVG1_01636 [Fusarium avenaceum]|nr:hypothetical protein FAVG1_01636 [Fusarium avenaceum]